MVGNCSALSRWKGLCIKHYTRQRRYGDVSICKVLFGQGSTFSDRFWSRVNKARHQGLNGDCWEWQGAKQLGGYGRVVLPDGSRSGTHQVAYFLKTGVWPSKNVLHSCDNPPCCNPDHLREGTQVQNVLDMVERGRSARGEKHPNSLLTDANVRHINRLLAQGFQGKDIAESFGVSEMAISDIKLGKKWKHIIKEI